MSASEVAPLHSITEPLVDYLPGLQISGVPARDDEVAWIYLRQPTIQRINKLGLEANSVAISEAGPVVRVELAWSKKPSRKNPQRYGLFMFTAMYELPVAYVEDISLGEDFTNDLLTRIALRDRGIPAELINEAAQAVEGDKSHVLVFSCQQTMEVDGVEIGMRFCDPQEWTWWRAR